MTGTVGPLWPRLLRPPRAAGSSSAAQLLFVRGACARPRPLAIDRGVWDGVVWYATEGGVERGAVGKADDVGIEVEVVVKLEGTLQSTLAGARGGEMEEKLVPRG